MKKILFAVIVIVLVTVCHKFAQAQHISSNGTQGETTVIHQFVNLGLSDSTLWSTCNIGASSPTDFGDYFAHGETESKDVFNWHTYKWCEGTEAHLQLTRYNCRPTEGKNGFTDSLLVLLPEDDAATILWGEDWQIPSEQQIKVLIDECTWTWIERDSIVGYEVKSRINNNSILPQFGIRSLKTA